MRKIVFILIVPLTMVISLDFIEIDFAGELQHERDAKVNDILKVQGRIESKLAEGGKVNGAKKKQVAGKLGKIFDCIRYSNYGNRPAAYLTVAELFGDLLSVGGLLPGLGPLISQVASGMRALFFTPTQGSIIHNALIEQYRLEKSDEGMGMMSNLNHIRLEIEILEDHVFEKNKILDRADENHLDDVTRKDTYLDHGIVAYMSTLRTMITREFEKTDEPNQVSLNDALELITLHCDLTTHLELLYTRIGLLIELGQLKQPKLTNWSSSVTRMQKWIETLHSEEDEILSFLVLPSEQNAGYMYSLLKEGNDVETRKMKDDLIEILRVKEREKLLRIGLDSTIEYEDVIEILEPGGRNHLTVSKCKSLTLLSKKGDKCGAIWRSTDSYENGEIEPHFWVLERSFTDEIQYGFAILSATTNNSWDGCNSLGLKQDQQKDQMNYLIRLNNKECSLANKEKTQQCYMRFKCELIYMDCRSSSPFIIKKAPRELVGKRSKAPRVVQKSSSGHNCITPCAFRGYSYQWCDTSVQTGYLDNWEWSWDWCSFHHGRTSMGLECKQLENGRYPCSEFSSPRGPERSSGYRWCHTNTAQVVWWWKEKWDYCSIVDIDVFHKAETSRCKDEWKPDGSCKDLKATWKQPDQFSYVGKCNSKTISGMMRKVGEGISGVIGWFGGQTLPVMEVVPPPENDESMMKLEDQTSEMRCYGECSQHANATGCEFNKFGTCIVYFEHIEVIDVILSAHPEFRCFVFETRVGSCLDQNMQPISMKTFSESSTEQSCYGECKLKEGVTACQYNQKTSKCSFYNGRVRTGDGDPNYRCWIV